MPIVRTYAHPLRKLKSGCRDQMAELSTITIYSIEYEFLRAKLMIRGKTRTDPMHTKSMLISNTAVLKPFSVPLFFPPGLRSRRQCPQKHLLLNNDKKYRYYPVQRVGISEVEVVVGIVF